MINNIKKIALCLVAITLLALTQVSFSDEGANIKLKLTESMPKEFYQIDTMAARKEAFINIMLKVIANVNQNIPEDQQIPTSIILAQAALETGWGTSRFLKEGNALFGEWTWNKDDMGIKPKRRLSGTFHRVKAFPTLEASLESYIKGLNSKTAYKPYRTLRAKTDSVYTLCYGLRNYSQEKDLYVQKLHTVIKKNNLTNFDNVEISQR